MLFRLFLSFFYFCLVTVTATSSVWAQEDNKGASGFPLPRFASLQTDEINMRTGPGTRYPIEWVYVCEGLPVEITAEFDVWRRIRDWEGSEGWIHQNALTGKRRLIVTGQTRNIYEDPDTASAVKAHAEPGAIGTLLECQPLWCKVKFDDMNGYMPKSAFWGTYANETFN
ncbi:MAG: SH3 domain-containing protein [Bdellovibrionales bacterium]